MMSMLLLVGCGVSKDVKNEISDISEKIKNTLLDEYPENINDTEMIEISDISYLINKVEKYDGYKGKGYKIDCTWEINVSDSYLKEKGQRETLYHQIEYGYEDSEKNINKVELTLVINGKTYTSGRDAKNNNQIQRGEGGYEMPNENDKSITDYIQRVDPDLYNDMENRWNNME